MTFMKLFLIGVFSCIGIFLFVTAPPELPDGQSNLIEQNPIEVAKLFKAVNAINDAARLVYTQKIVGGGKAAGLKFGEDWSEPNVDKGPLPALFLRLVASQMERKPEPLGLYLGSDEPINRSNKFSEDQMQQFMQLKQTLLPQYVYAEDKRSIAMFPDLASAQPCVDCHNEHIDSPKKDWKMGDVMGATTWTYPSRTLSETELLFTSKALYAAVAEAYQIYLDKTKSFAIPISVGDGWPSSATRELPDVTAFMNEVLKEAGAQFASEVLVSELVITREE